MIMQKVVYLKEEYGTVVCSNDKFDGSVEYVKVDVLKDIAKKLKKASVQLDEENDVLIERLKDMAR